jgi:transposase
MSRLRCERLSWTVPRAGQATPSKACCAASALTGTRYPVSATRPPVTKKGGLMSIYIGIDWSEAKHDIAFVNAAGQLIAETTIPHTPTGLQKFDELRQRFGVAPEACLVALETAHNLVIDYLWTHAYDQVYVVPPSVVKSCRGRYRQSGARTDQSDAYLLANLLRTDHERLVPWYPDAPLTRQMRAQISLYRYLTRTSVQQANRLRAVLLRYYPAALEVFSGLNVQITLEFICAFPTPQAAAALSWQDFLDFATTHRYSNRKRLPACFARLQQAYPRPTAETIQVYQAEAVLLATLLRKSLRTKHETKQNLQTLFRQHADAAVFGSLPGAGPYLGPALLVKFGDDRRRFPTPASVQALAGTCPVTESSGKRKAVRFRRGCDREFRDIAQQWARCSVSESVWAAT